GGGGIGAPPFRGGAAREGGRGRPRRHQVPFLIVECRCSEDEIRRRLDQRRRTGETPSDADWSIYVEQRRRYESFGADEHADHLVLDTTAAIPDVVATIEAALRAHTDEPASP